MKKFMKKMWEKKNSKKGFTLVELIVVLVILAILAAIMVPSLIGWIDKAKEKQHVLEARNVYLATQSVVFERKAHNTDLDVALTDAEYAEISEITTVTVNNSNLPNDEITINNTTGVIEAMKYSITDNGKTVIATYAKDTGWTID